MAMIVKNNMQAINTLNQLNRNSSALSKSLQKLSTGMKINSSADDSSGYQISERMRVQIRALDQANYNSQNGNSMMKVAEGAVQSTIDILKTLKEKVINAANDTNTDVDRASIQKEIDQSIAQIDDNALVTFNGKFLNDGSHNAAISNTCTVLTSQALHESVTKTTALTNLLSRSGESLNLKATDNVTISYVIQGKTYTSTFKVSNNTLQAIFQKTVMCGSGATLDGNNIFEVSESTTYIGKDGAGNSVYTADNTKGIHLTAKTAGTLGQVAGFTISITSNTGEVNKAANAVLDKFTETIRAENESTDKAIVLQVGAESNQAIKVTMTDMRAVALGLRGTDGSNLSVANQVNANAAIKVLDSALQKCLDQEAYIGATRNRLDFTSANLTTSSENVQSAESTFRDADMAKEMTEYTKNNILLQTAQAMLAQANQVSQGVLSLLQ